MSIMIMRIALVLRALSMHGLHLKLAFKGKTKELQWNLDFTKCQGTGEIGSLYQGSFPYITL